MDDPTGGARIARPPRLMDAIVEQLRTMILDGVLAPGTPLRQEQLAERLGVSRMPLRQALQRLEQEGLVAFSPSGTAQVIELTKADVGELLDIREVVDGLAARVLARRGVSPLVAHRLQAAMTSMWMAVEKSEKSTYFIANADFHMTILEAAEYKRLNQFAGIVRMSTQAVYLKPQDEKDRLERSDEEHRQIFDAIQQGADKTAERLAREHVQKAWGHWYPPSSS